MRVWVSAHRDAGAFAEDRRGAQHHGHDHQLDVPDSAITGRAQHHQADRSAGRLSGPEYRSKCRVIFLENSNEKFRYLVINPTCEETEKKGAFTRGRNSCAFYYFILIFEWHGSCVRASLRVCSRFQKVALSWNFERLAHTYSNV